MEMLQLKYFYESSVNQSFAKTAQKYMVPATSVSASVKRLEKELGCELFDRSSNRIILNENGRRLKESLKVIFKELDNAVDSITSSSSDTREIKMLVRAMRGEITNFIIEYKTPDIKRGAGIVSSHAHKMLLAVPQLMDFTPLVSPTPMMEPTML